MFPIKYASLMAMGMLQAATPVTRVEIPHKAQPPKLTRDANLSDWADALQITDFAPYLPDDKGDVYARTKAYVLWGPDALYVAFEAEDPDPSLIHASPAARDHMKEQDLVIVEVDPTGKGVSAIELLCNPLGFQSDGLITEGAMWGDKTYDCLWESVGVRTDKGFVVKIRAPYTSFRRLPGEWGIRLKRFMPRDKVYGVAWPRQNRDIQGVLVQMAKGEGAPQEPGRSPVLVIGALTANREGTYEKGDVDHPTTRARVGADLRYSGNAFTLDATYRPDFSAVEADVDPLQINSRYKVEYPEKRPFFLEGMELFSGRVGRFGPRPFFSRSVAEPMYGAKASGQSSRVSWSFLGARDEAGGRSLVLDGATGTEHLQTRDVAAAARVRLDDRGSSLTFLGTDRALLGGVEGGGKSGMVAYQQRFGEHLKARLTGITGWARLPQTEAAPLDHRGTATDVGLDFNSRNWDFFVSTQAVSPNLALPSGFNSLTGYRSAGFWGGYTGRRADTWWTEGRVYLSVDRMDWWDGKPMTRGNALEMSLSLARQIRVGLNLYGKGREYVGDLSQPVRGLSADLSWNQLGWFKPTVNWSLKRTADLLTGAPAKQNSHTAGISGFSNGLHYNVCWNYRALNHDVTGDLIVKALQWNALVEYRFPRWAYVKSQYITTRRIYQDHREPKSYVRVIAGWQLDAFSQIYVGYARQRSFDPRLDAEGKYYDPRMDPLSTTYQPSLDPRRDPDQTPWVERVTEQGFFAKAAITFRF